jgi:phosphoribosylanthranilate isomerase
LIQTQLKVCCIASLKEAKTAYELGANSIGLVSSMPSGPGVISDKKIAEIIEGLPVDADTWVLTSKVSGSEIVKQLCLYQPNTVQIVESIPVEDYALIRKNHPTTRIVQVVHVAGLNCLEEAKRLDPFVDALLLDSGNPSADTKQLGGTGKTHDWGLSRKIVDSVRSPVYLAGGLNPSNLKCAIDQVGPFGVDICSGLRTNGCLDAKKIQSAILAIGRVRSTQRES